MSWGRNMRASFGSMRHNRRSVRLRGFDYSGSVTCLVTICTANRRPIFWCEREGVVHLSAAGDAANACWLAIPAHFPHVDLDLHTVQPDHVHGIITVRMALSTGTVGAQHVAPLPSSPVAPNVLRIDRLVPGSLAVIIRAYKAAVTRLARADAAVWQRGYHESILRDAGQVAGARNYVGAHPAVSR
jgi:putative transposase